MATQSTIVKVCSVCDFQKPNDDFNLNLSMTCAHERAICRQCVVDYIDNKVAEGEWDNLECPEKCPEIIRNQDIPQLLASSSEVLERFDRLALRSMLSDMPDFEYCLSPSCSSGQIHDGGASDKPIFKCQECMRKFCLVHHGPWHEGKSCAERDEELQKISDDHKAAEDEVTRIAKRCPCCSRPIEKNDGCDHMQCLKCKHEFCFICLVDYQLIRDHSNAFHDPKCTHHTDNLP